MVECEKGEKMDYINFSVTESKPIKDKDFKEFDVRVLLSGQQMIPAIFNAVEVMAAHNFKFAEFDLFTCSCGVPGCAGFQSPIVQKIKDNKVHWIFPDEGDYKTDKLEYVFDAEQFFDAFKNLINLILRKESNREFLTSNIDWLSVDEEEGAFKSEKEAYSINDNLEYAQNRFKEEEEFHLFLSEKESELYNKSFLISYNGEKYGHKISFDWLINAIINYEKPKDKDEYYENILLAIKSIKESLLGNNTLLERTTADFYRDLDGSVGFLSRWFNVFPENQDEIKIDIDFKKLSIDLV